MGHIHSQQTVCTAAIPVRYAGAELSKEIGLWAQAFVTPKEEEAGMVAEEVRLRNYPSWSTATLMHPHVQVWDVVRR